MKMAEQNTCDSTIKVNRVLARYFKTRLWDFLTDAIWRPMRKICVQVLKHESWPYKTLTGPIAMSEIVIHYALSKLTKWSNKLLQCFHTSNIL